MNLPDELLSGLQQQKEYIGLQIEEKAARLAGIIASLLAFLVIGTSLMYYWHKAIGAIAFLAACLLTISAFSFYRSHTLSRIIKEKEVAIRSSRVLLKNHLTEMTTPPDTVLHLCQAIRTISDIIREIKNLFKDKN